MSNNPPPTAGNVAYDPLPLTTLDNQDGRLYNAPPSPGPNAEFQTPLMSNSDGALPSGAAQPRFLGAALYDDPSGPHTRDSYASSHNSMPSRVTSEDQNSVYGFNDQGRMSNYRDDPSDAYLPDNNTSLSMPMGQRNSRYMEEKRAAYMPPHAKSKRKIIVLALIAAAILLILAVIIPVYFAVVKPKSAAADDSSSDDNSNSPNRSSSPTQTASNGRPIVAAIVTGGDGSEVVMDDGTKMTYKNPFGGTWYWDENDPLNNGARAQSWSPALNETFKYGEDRIRGVNIGGWLNTEPFISPALYQKYSNPAPVDEWMLSEAMRADVAGGGINQMETHYKEFITEQDFIEIAAAGLNYVRIPIGYWAIETRPGEPFLERTSWTYFLKAIRWARKYGLRINLDLHGIPGSQNGWNHSGKLGTLNFLSGPMGYANAQRTLDYIRILTQFITQPEYVNVVTMFGIMNEPQGNTLLEGPIKSFYAEAYKVVRDITGVGEGKGPFISFHDAFLPRSAWAGFLENGDRMSLDSHPYMCFSDQSDADMSTYAQAPCTTWGRLVNGTMGNFGLANAGEFSNAVTDCGLFLNGVGLGMRYDGTYTADGKDWPRRGSCDQWIEWEKWDATMIQSMLAFNKASIDALGNAFFWTWKIGNSNKGKVEAPAWSYKLGLENGWIPKDPREADGTCGNSDPWEPPLKAWQTGGSGAGNIPAAATAAFPWPPVSIVVGGDVATLPFYTPTGVIPTLPAPTFPTGTGSSNATPTYTLGSGWANDNDKAGLMVQVAGCSYLDPWVGATAAPPVCTPAAAKRRRSFEEPLAAPPSMITPAPTPS